MTAGREPLRLRPYAPADAGALADLYRRSVAALGPRAYTPQQVDAWLSIAPSPDRLQTIMADGRMRLLGADAGDRPLIFADLEWDGHIDLFYAAPEAAGTGLARSFYQALEWAAVEGGLFRLHAEASEVALPFFARQGFTVLSRRDLVISGTEIYNYAIEKRLTQVCPIRRLCF